MQINVNQLRGNSSDAGRQGWPWMRYFLLGLTQADRIAWGSVGQFLDEVVLDYSNLFIPLPLFSVAFHEK
jgi:hypothetical protein